MKILAIETSCDETAAAVMGDASFLSSSGLTRGSKIVDPRLRGDDSTVGPVVLSSVVSSQIDLHTKTGGVVPEVASRAHMEAIVPVIAQALLDAKQGEILSTKSEIRNKSEIQNSKLEIETLIENSKLKIVNYSEASSELQNIDYIAYTAGPGLIGSLLVGYNAAKAIAYARDLPLIPINHIEGHVYSAFGGEVTSNKKQETNNSTIQQFNNSTIKFPVLALTVSGGHTSLTLMTDHGKYENLGSTLDDAAGEAFDKVAKLLGLGYPGGPIVSKLAEQHRNIYHLSITNSHLSSNDQMLNDQINDKWKMENEKSPIGIVFPRPILNDGSFNFSFSGLKTAVLQKTIDLRKEYGEELPDEIKSEICCAFEDAVVDVLVTKTMRAAEKYQPKAIILAGGVAANKCLRETLKSKVESSPSLPGRAEVSPSRAEMSKVKLLIPEMKYCGDNAAMIGLAAYYHVKRGDTSTWDKAILDSNLELN